MNILKYNKIKLEYLYSLGLIIISVYFYYSVLQNANISITEKNQFIDIFDGPSYYQFSFENLKIILSQHRTFGFPLFMKIYRFFDYNLYYWSFFSYVFYVFSIILFFNIGFKFKFNEKFLFLFSTGLILSKSFYPYIGQYTEFMSISLILISFSFFLISIKKENFIYYSLFSLIFFFTYQVRPSMVMFLFFFLTFVILYKYFFYIKIKLLPTLGCLFIPLIFFLSLRFFLVGDVGLVSFSVGPVGNSIHYLEQIDKNKLEPENQNLANKFLETKKKLPFPCNLDNPEEKYKHVNNKIFFGQYPCWGEYLMSSWLDVIKIKNNIQPFPDGDERNVAPWLHTKTLSSFYSNVENNVEINKILKNFSKDVYYNSLDQIIIKALKSPIYFLKLQKKINLNLIFDLFLIFLVLFIIKNGKIETPNRIGLEFMLLFSFLISLIPTLLILYIHENGEGRAVMFQTFYFAPICMSYLLYVVLRNSNFRFLF